MLAAPDLDKKIRIEVDISYYATGEVLFTETCSFPLKISK